MHGENIRYKIQDVVHHPVSFTLCVYIIFSEFCNVIQYREVFMMRHALYALILFFLISSIAICQEVIIFSYDFNKDDTGKPPSDPWKSTPAGKIEIADFPSKANKSVKITDNGSGGGMSLILDSPIKGKTVSIEFKWFREEGDATGVEIFYIMNQKCPDDWSGICVKTESGKIGYNDSGTWFEGDKFNDGVWYDFKYVMYTDKDKYDFFLNGKQIAKTAGFRNFGGLNGAGIDKFNVANVGNGGSTFIMYFDDIILYEGTIKPFAVKSEGKLATLWGAVKISSSEDPFRKYPGDHKGTRFEKRISSQSKWR